MTTPTGRSYRWLFWTLALVGLTLDLSTKYGIFGWLSEVPGESAAIIPGAFWLETSFTAKEDADEDWARPLRTLTHAGVPRVNKGALWGIGGRNERDEPGTDFNHVFAYISVAAALAIIIWSCRKKAAQEWFLCMALGLILGGTLGNLYDRVVFSGVRDFLHWNKWFDWPVFNIADCCLVCGAGLLLLQAFFSPPAEKELAEPAEPETAIAPIDSEVA